MKGLAEALVGGDGSLIWLAFLALTILSLSVIQLQIGRSRHLQRDCRQMQTDVQMMQGRLRDRENSLDQMQRAYNQLLKWRDRSFELEEELKRVKQKQDYISAQRQQFLEDYIASETRKPPAQFLATFSPASRYSFEDRLRKMLEAAEFEIVIVSPWIKKHTWDRIRGPLPKFVRRGGKLRVFMRGCESDYRLGMSDDLHDDLASLGGEITLVAHLHAKIYLVDRRDAIIASANLTNGGVEDNYEAGLWLNDPAAITEICSFVDNLQSLETTRKNR